jgi:hypothetical protein
MYPVVFLFKEENETDTEMFMSPHLLLTFWHKSFTFKF